VPSYALNFYSPIVEAQLKANRKTATIRLGDKSRKYQKGMIVSVLAGARFSARQHIFDAVIDKVEVKTIGELSPNEIEHDNPEIRHTEELCKFLGQLYNRDVTEEDTITLIRSAIRGLLAAADTALANELRGVITSGDAYTSTAKPQIDWDDQPAREALIDSRARDGFAMLTFLEGRELDRDVNKAARLLATVLGQDLIEDAGVLRIARGVAVDRVISTVNPQARHGHKTNARSFDGYKGHVAADPDSEIITATQVTPGNSGDAEVAEDLLADILPAEAEAEARPAVYGDAAYGAGELLARLDNNSIYNGLKVQPPARIKGHYGKDSFTIDLDAKTVTCPAGIVAGIRAHGGRHAGTAEFGAACADCQLRDGCTTAKAGRGRLIRSGRPTTGPLARRWNARSGI